MLYIGVTSRLHERVLEHRMGKGGAYTSKYHCHRLVYMGEEKERMADTDIESRMERIIRFY